MTLRDDFDKVLTSHRTVYNVYLSGFSKISGRAVTKYRRCLYATTRESIASPFISEIDVIPVTGRARAENASRASGRVASRRDETQPRI